MAPSKPGRGAGGRPLSPGMLWLLSPQMCSLSCRPDPKPSLLQGHSTRLGHISLTFRGCLRKMKVRRVPRAPPQCQGLLWGLQHQPGCLRARQSSCWEPARASEPAPPKAAPWLPPSISAHGDGSSPAQPPQKQPRLRGHRGWHPHTAQLPTAPRR